MKNGHLLYPARTSAVRGDGGGERRRSLRLRAVNTRHRSGADGGESEGFSGAAGVRREAHALQGRGTPVCYALTLVVLKSASSS